ncbi:MAG TPA: nuclease-related domain-containing protein [Mycobacteriales bacterium]|jgi:hypothetical protein
MGDLTLTPWRRYGHDRVYIARGDAKLGYLNRVDGSLVLGDETVRAEVEAALTAAGYLDRAAPAGKSAAVAVDAGSPPNLWALTLPGDTAMNRPGASARAMARAHRDAAPVRTAVARLLNLHTDERAWRRGADGEEMVGRRLERLDPTVWTALHDLPVGDRGANVDHLVIGPPGVFSMNTKNLTGTVWVAHDVFFSNRGRTDFVPKARYEARRVARVLSRATGTPVRVHGVLVVFADRVTVKEQPRDVTVVLPTALTRWLEWQRPCLTPEQVRSIARAARNPRTWY